MSDLAGQYSPDSAARLAEATGCLTDALARYASQARDLRGTPAEDLRLIETSSEVLELVRIWSRAVLHHTGFDVLSIGGLGEFGDEEYDEDEPGLAERPHSPVVSVVSRFDLSIIDPAALMTAGRAAYLSENGVESMADARAVIETEVDALRAVVNDKGFPWWHVPGAEVDRGTVAYFTDEKDSDEPADSDALAEIAPPEGSPAFVEGYTAL